jgi:energy-coupling factor transporter ATP-binding protein EcfA2
MDSVLRAEEVGFVYPQNGFGLTPVSISMAEGDIVHINSPSGGGKSTLARCLTGLIPHMYHGKLTGAVWVCDHRTDQTPLWQISESAGMVFQNPATQMLAPTVEEEIIFGLENLGLGKEEIEKRVGQVLDYFALGGMKGRSPMTLSGGEQQKLSLAAVMARQPKLLVLDEPLSMLDTTTAFDFVDLLGEGAEKGTAIAICEHRYEYLRGLPGRRLITLEGLTQPDLDEESITWPGNTRPECEIVGCNLGVKRGGAIILDGWDFNLRGGELTAVVGRNGVGKTTLFRLLAGLQPYTGELCIKIQDKTEPLRLGMVFQNPDLQLFNASVREEILYGLPAPDMNLYNWLVDVMDIQRYQASPPLLLSEGEKRRVALATILMRQPEHGILLDEPALGQDTAHKMMLARLLRCLAAAGQIVAYSTHDVELALQADRVVLLGSNGIITSASPEELRNNDEAWQKAGLRLPEWLRSAC